MTKLMKAAVVYELGKPLVIEEVPVPEPAPDQILVRIAATGVCHTDLHAAKGDWPVKPTVPFIPGHEGVGTVVGIGRSVKRGGSPAGLHNGMRGDIGTILNGECAAGSRS